MYAASAAIYLFTFSSQMKYKSFLVELSSRYQRGSGESTVATPGCCGWWMVRAPLSREGSPRPRLLAVTRHRTSDQYTPVRTCQPARIYLSCVATPGQSHLPSRSSQPRPYGSSRRRAEPTGFSQDSHTVTSTLSAIVG